jgi:high-affinity nickel-transport protein
MTSFALIASVGFLLGMRHATDPDHVIAVSTIVSRQRGVGMAGVIGAIWGLGHTLTIFAVGVAIILFKVAIPARLGLSMEFSVGLMLILLGVLNLSGMLARLASPFSHNHNLYDLEPIGTPDLASSAASSHPHPPHLWNFARPMFVGIVHGLAGSAAIALLVMTTIQDPFWEIIYVLIFGLGTIAGMMAITACIALPFAYTSRRFSAWNRGIVYTSGVLSICFGLFVSYQTGFVNGLFTAHPHWTPQ